MGFDAPRTGDGVSDEELAVQFANAPTSPEGRAAAKELLRHAWKGKYWDDYVPRNIHPDERHDFVYRIGLKVLDKVRDRKFTSRGAGSFERWSKTVACNVVKDWYRGLARECRKIAEYDRISLHERAHGPEKVLERKEAHREGRANVSRAFEQARLNTNERLVLMETMEGKKPEDIATERNWPRERVYKLKHSAKQKIKMVFGSSEELRAFLIAA